MNCLDKTITSLKRIHSTVWGQAIGICEHQLNLT